MSSVLATLPARRSGNPVAATLRLVAGRNLRVAVWFWCIAVVAVVVVTAITSRFVDPSWSIVAWARQGVIWTLFSLAIAVAAAALPAAVAAGVTRRSFVRGAVAAQVVCGLGYTVVMVAALQVERVVHGALGWGFEIRDFTLDPSGTSLGLLLADYASTFVVAGLSGLLVGAIYLRGRGWWGTLTLPLTVAPIILAGGLIGSVFADESFGLTGRMGLHLVLTAGLVAALVVAYALVTRGTQLRTTS